MSVTVANIIPRKQAEPTETIQYTVSSGTTVIDKFTVTNTSSVAVTFSCYLAISGGSAGNENKIIDNKLIAVDETYLCPELVLQVLANGGRIITIAGAGGALTISASGREIRD
jgi:hypothetical protein